MEITALLTSFIYLISSSLLLPVLLVLSAAIIWLFVYTGSFFGSWLQRKRLTPPSDPVTEIQTNTLSQFSPPVQNFVKKLTQVRSHEQQEAATVNLLRETEQRLWKSLDNLKILVRIGPGLGLIGTLIPMGTGLAGLSQGDLTRLSGDLVIAFTTTVVGMALGLVSYCFFTIQRRWVEDDIKNIELAAELLSSSVHTNSGES